MSIEPFADRPDLVQTVDGRRMLTPKGIGLMLGITEAEVDAEYERGTVDGKPFEMPPAWKRRANELMAWNNTTSMFRLLRIALDKQDGGDGQQ